MSVQLRAQSQPGSPSVVVVFEDGEKLEVSDWNFYYTWRFVSGAFYTERALKTSDLLVEVAKRTERGVTVTDDRRISSSKLASIKYDLKRNANRVDLVGVTITLTDGEVIRADNIVPSPKLISKGSDETKRHQVSLRGSAIIAGKVGEFSMYLKRPSSSLEKPSEILSEILFQPSSR